MAKYGKKYLEVKEKAPKEAIEIEDAITFLKESTNRGFDETAELAVRLGLDPKKSELAVRGTVSLPNGTGKDVNVLVFATGQAADDAREAGADNVGFEDMIEKVKGGWTEFDVAIATPDAMKEVRKLGRVLGPRGLMPNPKTGTVTDDTGSAVAASKAGKVEFRMDRHGNVSVPFGKLSFDVDKLRENVEVVIAAIKAERPASAKGVYMKNVTISSTMGVGLKVLISG